MPSCRHGNYTKRKRPMTNAEAKVAQRHTDRKRCGGEVFGHPGTILGIFTVVCCTKCGQVS